MTSPRRILVLGGARSGKSAHAEFLAGAGQVRYLATARRNREDVEWEERIGLHRDRRPGHWSTVETAESGDLAVHLAADDSPTLVDDLGTWLTAELDRADAWSSPRGTIGPAADALVGAVQAYRGTLVLVSPEVGLAVVPESSAGRLFRDEIGSLNSRIAAVCDEVVLVVAGLPLVLKDAGTVRATAAQTKGTT